MTGVLGVGPAPGARRLAPRWAPGVDRVVALGFEPLPWPSGSLDQVIDTGELACLPVSVWRRVLYDDAAGRDRVEATVWRPRLYLLGEIWRVLAPDGLLVAAEPAAAPAWGTDPRHDSPAWTEGAWRAYCGADPAARAWGLPGAWTLVETTWAGGVCRAVLRKGAAG